MADRDSNSVTFTGHRGSEVTLRNRVMTASGCFGDGTTFARAAWLGQLGAIVTRSITTVAQRSWTGQGAVETAAGLVYIPGVANPGIYRTVRDAGPVWSGLDAPIIVSIAAESAEEFCSLAIELESVPGVVALELNLAHAGAMLVDRGGDHEPLARLTEIVSASTSLPLFVKLGPANDLVSQALAAERGGAAAVTLSHGWPGIVFTTDGPSGTRRRHEGLLAGPAILPLTLRLVAEVASSVEIGVIGCGGVAGADAARQYLAAGARAVQVGSALFRNPALAAEIAAALALPSTGAPVP